MGDSHSTEKHRNLLVLPSLGPDYNAPMVAHQHRAQNPQKHSLVSLVNDTLEGSEGSIPSQQPQPSMGPTEQLKITPPIIAHARLGMQSNPPARITCVTNDSRPL